MLWKGAVYYSSNGVSCASVVCSQYNGSGAYVCGASKQSSYKTWFNLSLKVNMCWLFWVHGLKGVYLDKPVSSLHFFVQDGQYTYT